MEESSMNVTRKGTEDEWFSVHFTTLFRKTSAWICSLGFSWQRAEDLAEESLVKLERWLADNPSSSESHRIAVFRQISRNTALDGLRQKYRRELCDVEIHKVSESDLATESLESVILANDFLTKLKTRLTIRQNLILEMKFDKNKYDDIALSLAISPSLVKLEMATIRDIATELRGELK